MKKYWIMTAIVVFMLSLLVHPSTTNAANTVVYVKSNASGANNGSSWADAYTSLSAALTASNPANGNTVEIWVAAGTYKPTQDGNRDAAFTMKNNVSLYGGFNGTEATRDERDFVAHPTILSGDLNGNDTATVGIFETNRAENSKVVVKAQNINNSVTIDGFQVTGGHNVTLVNGTYQVGFGSGILLQSSHATVRNVTFTANVAGYGGGIYVYGSTSSIINVQFINNVAAYSGGGFYAQLNHPYLSNAVFTANRAASGGALAVEGAMLTASNITSSGNKATNGGFVSTKYDGTTVDIANSIIWNDTSTNEGPVFITAGTVSINYSLIQAGYTGTGNISSDPRFIDAAHGDFKLDDASPAIDAGNNSLVALDVTDVDHDGNTSEVLPVDVTNASRFVDHPQPDSGVGSPPIVDMGAYETPAPVYITVSGTVTDSNGNPVSGVTVSPFTIQGVEVTQVIQNMANTIPLVADKPTVTRVYVKSYASVRVPLTVQLSGKRNNAPLANSPLSTQIVAPNNPSRAIYSDSANFVLPASWLSGQVSFAPSFVPDPHAVAVTDANGNYTLMVKAGTYTLFAQKDATTYGNQTVVLTDAPQTVNFGFTAAYHVYIPLVTSANTATSVASNNVTVKFTVVPAMNIKILPIYYTYQGTTYPAPAASEFNNLATFIKARYPVSAVNITFANPVFMNATPGLPPTQDMVQQVYAIKQSDGAPSSQFYYGVSKIPNGIDNAAGRGYLGMRAAAGVSASDFLAAHEMGHNMGLKHPCEDASSPYQASGLIGEYGINLSTNPPQVYAPNQTSSIMNPGCSFPFYQNSWFSDYEYVKMFNDQVTNGLLNNKKLDSLVILQ